MKNFYYLGLCALLAGAFGACKDDIVSDNGGNSIADMDGETGYLSFRIKSANTGGITRAWLDNVDDGDYATGEDKDDTGNMFAGEDDIVLNVQANRVLFFNEDGTYHSSSLLTKEGDETSEGAIKDEHDDGYQSLEKIYSTTVKKTSDRGESNWPTQCLVILNGRPSRLNALTEKLKEEDGYDLSKFLLWINEDLRDSDPEGLTLGLYLYGSGDNGKYYFTMTNSIYFDEDQNQINTTEIKDQQLCKTREEARENPVTVYVERIMAKVEVGFVKYDGQSGETPGYFSNDMDKIGFLYSFTDDREQDINFVDDEGDENNPESDKLYGLITNWTINGVEFQTHLFKNINTSWSTNVVKSDFKLFDEWNDERHHRSYWAQDPHYTWVENQYPTQYRKAFGNKAMSYQDFRVEYPVGNEWVYGEDVKETEKNEQNNDIFNPSYPWALDYKSFNSVTTKRKAKYCLENTFDMTGSESAGYKHMIMGSHLLIQARLLNQAEKDKLESLNLDDVSDKYYYSDTYYTKNSFINNRVTSMANTLSENVGALSVKDIEMWPEDNEPNHTTKQDYKFDNIEGGIWIKEGDKYKKVVAKVSEDNKDNEIAATEVFGIAPAYVAKGDGKVSIALLDKNGPNGFGYGSMNVNLYYVRYNQVDNGQPVKQANVQQKDGTITQEDNTPVQFTRNQLVSLIYQVAGIADCFKEGMMYYAVPIQHYIANGSTYDYKFKDVDTGDYGVVRNHWYKFTINQIEKPGIPVHDPNQPIIPNYDDEDRYIGLQVIILPWHIVDNGNVTLGPNK